MLKKEIIEDVCSDMSCMWWEEMKRCSCTDVASFACDAWLACERPPDRLAYRKLADLRVQRYEAPCKMWERKGQYAYCSVVDDRTEPKDAY